MAAAAGQSGAERGRPLNGAEAFRPGSKLDYRVSCVIGSRRGGHPRHAHRYAPAPLRKTWIVQALRTSKANWHARPLQRVESVRVAGPPKLVQVPRESCAAHAVQRHRSHGIAVTDGSFGS